MFDQLWTDHTQLNEQLKLINWTKYKRSNYASFIVIKPNQKKQTNLTTQSCFNAIWYHTDRLCVSLKVTLHCLCDLALWSLKVTLAYSTNQTPPNRLTYRLQASATSCLQRNDVKNEQDDLIKSIGHPSWRKVWWRGSLERRYCLHVCQRKLGIVNQNSQQ